MLVLSEEGVINAMSEKDLLKDVIRVSGSSGGAGPAVAVALGCTAKQRRLFTTDISHIDYADGPLMDPHNYYSAHNVRSSMWGVSHAKRAYNVLSTPFRFLQNLPQLFSSHALNPGERLYDYFGELIAEIMGHADFTFGELAALHDSDPGKYKLLYLPGACLNTSRVETFSHERHSDMPIRKALLINMAAPYLIQPVEYNGRHYFDGAYARRDPIELFDKPPYNPNGYPINPNSLAIRPCYGHLKKRGYIKPTMVHLKQALSLDPSLDDEMQLPANSDPEEIIEIGDLESWRGDYPDRLLKAYPPPRSLLKFQARMENVLLNAESNSDPVRTVFINLKGHRWDKFDMPTSEKEILVKQGYDTFMKYHKNYLDLEGLEHYQAQSPIIGS